MVVTSVYSPRRSGRPRDASGVSSQHSRRGIGGSPGRSSCLRAGRDLVPVDVVEGTLLASRSSIARPRVDEAAERVGVSEEDVQPLERLSSRSSPWRAPSTPRPALDRDPRAGDVRDREARASRPGLPGGERDREHRDLDAAGVELEPEEVVGEDGVLGSLDGRALLLDAHRQSISKASTRKWPDPQQGSITVTSATRSGQPSKDPAAGLPSRRSAGTPTLRRAGSRDDGMPTRPRASSRAGSAPCSSR